MPTRRRTRVPPRNPEQRLIAAAFELAAEKGWRRTGLAEIAAAARMPLNEAYGVFRSKFAILRGFRRSVDEAVLAGPRPSLSDPPRDRLFDVLMRRFEALKPHRQAIRAILRGAAGDPVFVKTIFGLLGSMTWMLEAAGIPASGCRGRLACRLCAGLYMSVFPVFLRDESEDLGTTMAALDRRLRQVEGLIAMFGPLASRARRRQA